MRADALATSLTFGGVVSMLMRQTSPWRPRSLTCRKPGRWKEKKLVTKSFLLSLVTAIPRGWKWKARSGLHALPRSERPPSTVGLTSFLPAPFPDFFVRRVASMTVMLSWLELAT